MTERLWRNICNHFCDSENSNKDRYCEMKGREFFFDGKKEHELDGIISQLTKECCGSEYEAPY